MFFLFSNLDFIDQENDNTWKYQHFKEIFVRPKSQIGVGGMTSLMLAS